MGGFNGNEDGQTLIPVIIVFTVLFITTTALGTIVGMSNVNMYGEGKMLQAYYAAEAGIEKTMAAIRADSGWLAGIPCTGGEAFITVFPETGVGNGVTNTVAVAKEKQLVGSLLKVRSVGKCKAGNGELLAQKTLEYEVVVYNPVEYFQGLMILPDRPGNFNFDGVLRLTGAKNLVFNGDINLFTSSIQLGGDLITSGDVKGLDVDNHIAGQIHELYTYIPPFPELDTRYYFEMAGDNGQVYDTDTYFGNKGSEENAEHGDDGTIPPGVTVYSGFYYVDGDVSIAGNYSGTALVFSTGTITVAGDLRLASMNAAGEDTGGATGGLTLVSLEDVVIDGEVVDANIIAGGCLLIRPGARLYGAACVGNISYIDGIPGTGEPFMFEVCEKIGVRPVEGALNVQIKEMLWQEQYPVF